MCVGYTHTGKTTFAKKLVKKYPNMIQLDSDEVAVFTKEKYPLLVESSYNKNRPDFRSLKMVIFKDVYNFCLNAGFNIILSNCNLAKNFRSFVSYKARKQGYKLVTIYFNLPEEVILRRLKETRKSDKVFIQSKKWSEVFERQKKYAQLPTSKRNTIYCEIKGSTDDEIVINELSRLL